MTEIPPLKEPDWEGEIFVLNPPVDRLEGKWRSMSIGEGSGFICLSPEDFEKFVKEYVIE